MLTVNTPNKMAAFCESYKNGTRVHQFGRLRRKRDKLLSQLSRSDKIPDRTTSSQIQFEDPNGREKQKQVSGGSFNTAK